MMKMGQIIPSISDGLLRYDISEGVTAFSTTRDASLPFHVIQARQVHGDRIAAISDPCISAEALEGIDAMVTNLPGLAIGVRTADCVPVLLYDPDNRAVAAVHSGWKGTVMRIAAKAIRTMSDTYGTYPSNLLAVIGPSIGPDSFQVGAEVAERFEREGFPITDILTDEGERIPGTMSGGLHINLWKANRLILEEAGVPSGNIFVSGIDTYGSVDFFSARREGIQCGRIINAIMVK